MHKICVPFEDEDLIHGAKHFRIGGNEPDVVTPSIGGFSDLGGDDILYVLAHGRYSTSSEIVGVVKGRVFGTRQSSMKANDLAEFLKKKGLSLAFCDLRLLVCWGGYVGGNVGEGKHELKRQTTQAPFAGQLCSAMKDKHGYKRIRVTGYRGEVNYAGKGKDINLSSVLVNLPAGPLVIDEFGQTMKNGSTNRKTFTLDNRSRTVWY